MGWAAGHKTIMATGVVRGALDAVLQDENIVASSLSPAVRAMGTSLLQRVTESDSSIEVFDRFCQDITRGMQGILTSNRDKRVAKANFRSTFHDFRMTQLQYGSCGTCESLITC